MCVFPFNAIAAMALAEFLGKVHVTGTDLAVSPLSPSWRN
jgi:hypothetical protein